MKRLVMIPAAAFAALLMTGCGEDWSSSEWREAPDRSGEPSEGVTTPVPETPAPSSPEQPVQ